MKHALRRAERFLFRSLARKTLDVHVGPFLREHARGRVLEIGARSSPYRQLIDAERYEVLDVIDRPGVDHVQDIHQTDLPDGAFDTIVATEVLEHLYHPHVGVEEMQRILSPGGWLIGSTRFIHSYHDEPYDYFRFTIHGLKYLLRDFRHVEVIPLGNGLTAVLDMVTMRSRTLKPLRLLNVFVSGRKIRWNSKNPSGLVFRAQR